MRSSIASWRIAMLAVPIGLCLTLLPIRATALTRIWDCFFEPGSDALSPRCERIMAEFVDWWLRNRDGVAFGQEPGLLPARMLRVQIEGHTDAAEAAQERRGLGERRARAMAEWLIAAGIPRVSVSTQDNGADALLVPTQRGVAEPQNRRVQIIDR